MQPIEHLVIDAPRLANINQMVEKGLDFDRLKSVKIKAGIQTVIRRTAAQTIADCEQIIGRRIAKIATVTPNADEDAFEACAYPSGLIEISSYYLQYLGQELADSNSSTEDYYYLLNCESMVLAHEMYHLRESHLFPRRWTRTAGKPHYLNDNDQRQAAWLSDWGEYAAELFALSYLGHYKPQGPDDARSRDLIMSEVRQNFVDYR